MRFLKFKLPLWVAGGLLATASATAFEPSLYTQVAQAQAPAPVIPAVPEEDAYQMRALPPQEAAEEVEEGPNRYLELPFLKDRGIATYGWIDAGIGANNWGYPWNGPITFNDRAWQGQMNQLYLVNEKVLDLDANTWDWGGRVDLLYGTDYIFTTARGLDGNLFYQPNPAGSGGAPSWVSSKYYGLAMPQLYGELGYGDHAVKFGHFYTIIGYEVVPAIGNFFYSHAYTMQYGEPFTHTGILDVWTVNDQLTIYGGITNGWDNFSDPINYFGITNPAYPGANSNAAFLGGATFKSSDEAQALTMTVSSGNEIGSFTAGVGNIGNRSILSTVYVNELNDKVTYVFQNDNGWQFNANTVDTLNQAQPGTALWYGINQYLFYNFSDNLVGGMRLEWFRDNNGYRVISPIRNALYGGPFATGYQGNFWQATWGLNWKPQGSRNWMVRPELRYDWYTPDKAGGALPFGNFNEYGQLYGGCDVIWQF
ncbi:MAG: porin [Planctomycetes bacterium]|nr:porin [Planctomycetota bacterium]